MVWRTIIHTVINHNSAPHSAKLVLTKAGSGNPERHRIPPYQVLGFRTLGCIFDLETHLLVSRQGF